MELSAAVWTLIVLALLSSNLPFVLDRPLVAFPWRLQGESGRSAPAQWLRSIVFFVLLAVWIWLTHTLVGEAFAGGGATALLSVLKVLLMCGLAGGLLFYPGWHAPVVDKPFIICLLELLVGYALVGTLGFALELNIGNAFAQRWEFYAVTLSLFLVLGYPGFVYRYMLRKRRRTVK